ncbi:M23 family metallopeptidase [Shimia sp. SDUM112013]|uniref:M23 family metallopeptidase n=1 Tax=Shimia sp. SDUM112013 TaxID=3136160 RepID=UPI0032EF7928
MTKAFWAFIGSLIALPAMGEPSFIQPIDCELGETCYIQNYVDRDPGPGFRDFACDRLTYDGHKGTDFAILGDVDINTYFRGLDVLAAADGVVLGVRNTMADKPHPSDRSQDVSGKECGNGVVIDHGDGWHTQYCHLKNQSVRVKQGQSVTAGDVLGQTGLSGLTSFRHLHFSVRKDGQIVDPFSADSDATCTDTPRQIWAEPVAHVPTGLIAIGVHDAVPDYEDLVALPRTPNHWAHPPAALVIWAMGYGSDPADRVALILTGPDGAVFDTAIPLDKAQSRYFRAYGKKRPAGGWPSGTYTGTATIERNGQVMAQDTLRFTLP